MVEVKINDESFAYDIHSLIQAFYGGEEVQVRVGDAFTEEVPVQMAVQVTDQDISYTGRQGPGSFSGSSMRTHRIYCRGC